MTISWVIREKSTGHAITEVKDSEKMRAGLKHLKPKFEAVPVLQHLQELNDPTSLASQWMRRAKD